MMLDVFMLVTDETIAPDMWKRLTSKAPHAKMIKGVQGIAQAHMAAAQASTSPMFWVFDGKAQIMDDFDLDWQPPVWDHEWVHVFRSINPVNGLVYGHGAAKLMPRHLILNWQPQPYVDWTTTWPIKTDDRISNINHYNWSAWSSWRTAFREAAKLASGVINGSVPTHVDIGRLARWQAPADWHAWGAESQQGALAGAEWARNNPNELTQINNREWLWDIFQINKNNFSRPIC